MFDLVIEYRVEAQRIASILLGLAMWRWGGGPERCLALVFVGLFTLPTTLLEMVFRGSIIFVQGGVFYAAIDLLALLLFVAIALQANRNYTLWVAAFQIVAAASHVVRLAVDVITPLAHAIMAIGPSYFQLIFMAAGLILHVRRKKRYGEYRDWRVPMPYPFGPRRPPDILRGQS